MAKRRKVALVYQYNENWIGGTYYIENLVKALLLLPKKEQPFLYVLTEEQDDYDKLQQITGNSDILKGSFFEEPDSFKKIVNKVSSKLSGKYIFSYFRKDINVLFPADINHHRFSSIQNLYWIPDFQEHYLPDYFTNDEIASRKQYQQAIADTGKFIVFSSKAAQQHFNEIYPDSGIRQFVLPFAVSHQPAMGETDIARYKLPDQFYICSNQFWRHKNHKIVLEAVAALKMNGVEIFVAFTGKEYDFRHPEYFNEVKSAVEDMGIINNVAFLGFIDRNDQLALMKKSLAVIQPSLFEGWSTVVEDAKSLGVHVIASDIDVHKEQLERYAASQLFDPAQSASLIECLLSESYKADRPAYEYHKNVLQFGQTFNTVIETILKEK